MADVEGPLVGGKDLTSDVDDLNCFSSRSVRRLSNEVQGVDLACGVSVLEPVVEETVVGVLIWDLDLKIDGSRSFWRKAEDVDAAAAAALTQTMGVRFPESCFRKGGGGVLDFVVCDCCFCCCCFCRDRWTSSSKNSWLLLPLSGEGVNRIWREA